MGNIDKLEYIKKYVAKMSHMKRKKKRNCWKTVCEIHDRLEGIIL